MARTAQKLWDEGYRIGPIENGFRVWRGAGGFYDLNCVRTNCPCRQFQTYRFCSHMDGLKDLCLMQREEILTVRASLVAEQKAIVAQIRRGGLSDLDVAELEREAQEMNDQDWKLMEELVALRNQMWAMGMMAGVEQAATQQQRKAA